MAGLFSCQNEDNISELELEEFIDGHLVTYSDLRFDPVDIFPANENARVVMESPYRYQLVSASYITADESSQMGRTVFFVDRGNKQLIFDWAPNLRLSGETDISYYIDRFRPASPSGLSIDATENAIEEAIGTWERARCSNIGLNRVENVPVPIGIVASQLQFPSVGGYIADVNHAGWMPGAFFNELVPNGANFILGVTFTFGFVDENGDLVDTNNDGKFDVALREIYYNNSFRWSLDGTPGSVDVETIVLHEMGHGLSQEHFGSAFVNISTGRLRFNPRAVMNASYSGVQRDLTGTDLAGHCSIWGNWPNN